MGMGSAFADDSPSKKYRVAQQNTQQAAIKNVELQYKNKKAPGHFDMIQNKGWLDVEASKVRLRHLKAGDKYYRQGEYEKAAQAYARILENDDTDAFANYRVGMAELGLKRHEVARLYLQNAVKYNPELYPAYTGLSASYIMDGRKKKLAMSLRVWMNGQKNVGFFAPQIAKCKNHALILMAWSHGVMPSKKVRIQ